MSEGLSSEVQRDTKVQEHHLKEVLRLVRASLGLDRSEVFHEDVSLSELNKSKALY
jgi:hypothetical protein